MGYGYTRYSRTSRGRGFPRKEASGSRIQIEYPSRGATYNKTVYGVYEYGVYPRSSVLAGQTKRTWLDAFDTLAEAKAAYPTARVVDHSDYAPPNLSHLPDDGDY